MNRIVKREIKQLNQRIKEAEIPRRSDNKLHLLTWNIRNFNKDKEDKAVTYISKVCKKFDLIAIQEVKDSLGGIERLQRKLGKNYRFLFSDPSGNGERLVFCYDQRQVQFTGLAAEIVMDPGSGKEPTKKKNTKKSKKKKKPKLPELEFERTPYMASFRKNGCNFIVVTVHIFYGKGSRVKYRLKEIQNIAKFLKKRSKDVDVLDSDFVACGDFNIEDVRREENKRTRRKSKTKDILKDLFKALKSQGLRIPEEIQNSPSNLSKKSHFDQIGFHKYKDSTLLFEDGGTIDFVGAVYVGDKKLRYKLTDHLPMWAVFSTSKDKNPKHINP